MRPLVHIRKLNETVEAFLEIVRLQTKLVDPIETIVFFGVQSLKKRLPRLLSELEVFGFVDLSKVWINLAFNRSLTQNRAAERVKRANECVLNTIGCVTKQRLLLGGANV